MPRAVSLRGGEPPMPEAVLDAFCAAARECVPLDQLQGLRRFVHDCRGHRPPRRAWSPARSRPALDAQAQRHFTGYDLGCMERLSHCEGFPCTSSSSLVNSVTATTMPKAQLGPSWSKSAFTRSSPKRGCSSGRGLGVRGRLWSDDGRRVVCPRCSCTAAACRTRCCGTCQGYPSSRRRGR